MSTLCPRSSNDDSFPTAARSVNLEKMAFISCSRLFLYRPHLANLVLYIFGLYTVWSTRCAPLILDHLRCSEIVIALHGCRNVLQTHIFTNEKISNNFPILIPILV